MFLRLGLTSFGGPVAHLGYFRDEFVVRRRWLTEHSYADLVALCQFLPGPASSQVGMALGLMRGGWGGALAAWVGFLAANVCFMVLSRLIVLVSLSPGAAPARGVCCDGLSHHVGDCVNCRVYLVIMRPHWERCKLSQVVR